ncbi:MAG: glutamine synthetase family protein [Armatimonas sp.]
MTRAELKQAIAGGEIDTVLAVIPDLYGRLLGKRLTGHYFLEHVIDDGMHVCDYLLACDMEMDPVPGYSFTNWERGYGDLHVVPDLKTLRRAAWLEKTAIVICDAHAHIAPRTMLQDQLAKLAERGFTAKGGSEIELYVFDESYESLRQKHYAAPKTAGNYIEDYHVFQGTKEEALVGAIRRALDASEISVESSKGEWGPGQQEINLLFCEALEQADRNALYKHAAKEIAWQQGKAVTFMAKWDETLAGSSMHVHLSLWKADGTSAFADEDLFNHFLGGMMHHARAITAFLAPNVASYKRYQAGSFAPTSIAWCKDNRTAGFRVVGEGKSKRIECRIPGADANPYLVYASLLAAGLDGVEQKIAPPPIFEGDVYEAQELPRVPAYLREAIAAFEESDFPARAFGQEIVEHYSHFWRTEQRKFDEVITDWEKKRFFERI